MSQPNATAPAMSRQSRILMVAESVLRTSAIIALILWGFSAVPETPDSTLLLQTSGALLGVVGYLWFFSRQVRKVKSAKYPIIRSVEALVVMATLFLAVFAAGYVIISGQNVAAFTEPLSHFTAFYFAVTVLATVGFGDITPVSDSARLVCMVQMALDIVFIGAAVKILGGAASGALRARATGGSKGARESDGVEA